MGYGYSVPAGLIPHLILCSLPLVGIIGCAVFAIVEWRENRR